MKLSPAARAAAQAQWMRDVMQLEPSVTRPEPTVTITRTGKGLQRLLELHDRVIARRAKE